MPLPCLGLNFESGNDLRGIARIDPEAVEFAFAAAVDRRICIVTLTGQHVEAHPRNIRNHKSEPAIAHLGAVRAELLPMVIIVVHNSGGILKSIKKRASGIDKQVALLEKLDGSGRARRISIPASD